MNNERDPEDFGTESSPSFPERSEPAREQESARDEETASAGDEAGEAAAEGGPTTPDERPRRRRGSRGGRRRRGRREGAAPAADADGPAVVDVPLDDELPLEGFDPAPARSRLADVDEPEVDAAPDADEGVDGAALPPDGEFVVQADSMGRKKRRRRGRRGGRGRAGDGAAPATAGEASGGERRAPRGGVPRELDAWVLDEGAGEEGAADEGVHGGDEGAAAEDDEVVVAAPGEAEGDDKRRRRGARGGRRRRAKQQKQLVQRARDDAPAEVEILPGEPDDLPLLPELPDDAELIDSGLFPSEEAAQVEHERKKGRRRRGAQVEEHDDADDAVHVPEEERNARILVNASDPEEQRVAVVEDELIVDFQMTVKDHDSLVNDIYRGRVVNLEPAIGAAFIDFGEGRNGFLHTSDVLSAYGEKDFDVAKLLHVKVDPEEWGGSGGELDDDKESGAKKDKKGGRPKSDKGRFRARPRLPITDLLKKGQQVVVQVTKDAIGDKGPTLTTYISIPGRYLVLMPSMSRTGVSRKIEDEKERRRLKRILQSLELPEGMGVIVRTAGVGHSKAEIKRDLDYLKNQWEALSRQLMQGHGPAVLYRESDIAIRTMRDLYTPYTKEVVVDDYEVHRHLVEFTEKLMPEEVSRVKLHEGQKPLFQSQAIEPDFEKMFARRVELPSGGSVVFDQAEALVAIDVNSGRTRSDGFDFEEIALKTNLEAAPEIARQIRLRDLGGIIVVDFIDMMKNSSIKKVESAFAEALSQDRARSKLGRISQFGLLEMTRQRLGPGLSKKVFHACPRCRGTGRLRTVNSRAAAILRRLASAMTLKGFQTVEVRAHPEVIRYLKESCHDHLRGMEYRFQRDIRLIEAPEQPEDSVLRYLRMDGKEVRPGGRRKR